MMVGGLTNESGSGATGSTRYLGLFSTTVSSSESTVQMVVPTAGTLSNLSVKLGTAPQNSFGTQKYTFTVRKNGNSSGSVSCEISESETSCSSTTTQTFAAGDLISLQSSPSNTPSGWGTLRWAVTLTQ